MTGQEQWTARAAKSYQELAKVFSNYVTDRQEPECECRETGTLTGDCTSCRKLARVKKSAYHQMMEGKEALVYQLQETAKYFMEMEDAMKREQYLSEAEKKELVSYLRRYHIKARETETAYRQGTFRKTAL